MIIVARDDADTLLILASISLIMSRYSEYEPNNVQILLSMSLIMSTCSEYEPNNVHMLGRDAHNY